MIEANPGLMPSATQLSAVGAVPPATQAMARLAMPTVPARSLPQPLSPAGELVEADLPPLPEALASTDLDRIKPAPNQPSPQAPYISDPFRDSQLARTSYDAAPPMKMERVDAEADLDPSRAEAPIDKKILGKVIEALERAGVMSIEAQGVVKGQTRAESLVADMEEMLDTLAKLGVQVSFDIDATSPIFNPDKSVCEKCNGDDPFCPAKARASSDETAPGGLKVVPEPSAQLGVWVKDDRGMEVCGDVVNLNKALKTPGKTETTLVPLGGNVALEIKTTVVPAPPENENTGWKKAKTSIKR